MSDTPKSFLVIDDSDEFSTLVAHHLRRQWPDATIDTWNPVDRGRPPGDFNWGGYDVVLLDYQLSGDDGLRWLRAYAKTPGFPLTIMLTAEGNEEVAVKAFKLGASDYIRKRQMNAAVLINAIMEAWAGREPPKAKSTGPFEITGYRLLEKIGQGATARVYRAERISDGQDLVIKALLTDGSGVDAYVERFLQEYTVIDRVRHPNVVRLYDRGCTSDSLYIAMEYFSGGDLHARLRGNRALPPAEALDCARQIAEGLAAIHKVGVIHRDLKPSNVMFRADGSLALIDFGIAKQVEAGIAYTQAGMVLGTPGYSSPENLTGKPVDRRSDLYSLGAILFEMLAGERPFAPVSTAALLYQQLNTLTPRLPTALEDFQPLIQKTMAANPDDRYADAREFLAALQDFEVKVVAAKST